MVNLPYGFFTEYDHNAFMKKQLTLADRVRGYMKENGVGMAAFDRLCDVPKETTRNLLRRPTGEIGGSKHQKIVDFLDVNKEKPLPETEVLMMSVLVDICSLLVGKFIPKDQLLDKLNYRKAAFEKYELHHSLRLLKILLDCVTEKSREAETQLMQLLSPPAQSV